MILMKQFEVWLANLDPAFGRESGKTRPVLIVQMDVLNQVHPSVIVCPITTNIRPESKILRVHLPMGTAEVKQNCDIMMDQLRAIDKRRFIRKIGVLPDDKVKHVKENLSILLSL